MPRPSWYLDGAQTLEMETQMSVIKPIEGAMAAVTTAREIGERARNLGVKPSMLLDFAAAVAELEAGRGLPAWADRWSIPEDDAIAFAGEYGGLDLSASIVYGEPACTSERVTAWVGSQPEPVSPVTSAKLRKMADAVDALIAEGVANRDTPDMRDVVAPEHAMENTATDDEKGGHLAPDLGGAAPSWAEAVEFSDEPGDVIFRGRVYSWGSTTVHLERYDTAECLSATEVTISTATLSGTGTFDITLGAARELRVLLEELLGDIPPWTSHVTSVAEAVTS